MDGQQQTPAPAKKSSTGPIIAIIGLIVIVVVGVVAAQGLNKPKTETATPATQTTQEQTTQQEAAAPTSADAMQASSFKDGTYTAVGDYTSPGGPEQIGVTLTVANGVVTDSQVEVMATRPMSKTKQTDFAEHYKTQVVGQKLETLSLTKVSGSSLSPKGFNDAVEKIKTEAKA